MTIYIVTNGSYSDYHICAVFSSREKADEAKVLLTGAYDEARVEEYEVDDFNFPEMPKGMLPYGVVMLKDGTVKETRRESVESIDDANRKFGWEPYSSDDKSGVFFSVWAKDEKHAVKIANERRTMLIANNEWTENFEEWLKKYFKKEDK